MQALVWLVSFFSFYERTFIYIGILGLGVVLAVFVSRGYYIKVLRGHFAMLDFWRRNISNRYAHQVRGKMEKGQNNPDIVFRIYQIVRNLPVLAVAAANPFVILALTVFVMRKKLIPHFDFMGIQEDLFFKIYLWSCAMTIIAVLVRQVKALEFVGEGERYLEYSAFPTAIVCSVMFLNGFNYGYKWLSAAAFLLMAAGSLASALFIQNKVVAKDTHRSVRQGLKKIFDFLNKKQEEIRLITIPLYLADAAMYFTRAKVLSTDSSIAHVVNYPDFFPVLKKPIFEIACRYNINYLLINENYVKLSELKLAENRVVKRENSFCLIDVSDLARG